MYYYYMNRRTQLEDMDLELERQCFNLAPDRWMQIYKDRLLGGIAVDGGESEIPLTVDDMDDLDEYMAAQELAYRQNQRIDEVLTGKHVMTEAQAPIDWRAAQHDAQMWSEWV